VKERGKGPDGDTLTYGEAKTAIRAAIAHHFQTGETVSTAGFYENILKGWTAETLRQAERVAA